MNFRTIVDLQQATCKITHQSKILFIGSCFSSNLGNKLEESKFNVLINPFGTIYNPISIKQSLERLKENITIDSSELFEHSGMFHHFDFHSDYSSSDKMLAEKNMNDAIKQGHLQLRNADFLFITFGTSFVFETTEDHKIVANCHKLPAKAFERKKIDLDKTTKEWIKIVKELKQFNPNLEVIFTVSPIRHISDGLHENQLSKAILLILVDDICKSCSDCDYFPAYEMLLDDLRDYRFYAEDMVHPSQITINYIWEKFKETYFNQETTNIIDQYTKLSKALNHRINNVKSYEHKMFLNQTLSKFNEFSNKYPFIDIETEKNKLKAQLALHFE